MCYPTWQLREKQESWIGCQYLKTSRFLMFLREISYKERFHLRIQISGFSYKISGSGTSGAATPEVDPSLALPELCRGRWWGSQGQGEMTNSHWAKGAGLGAGSPWGRGSIVKWSITNWPWLCPFGSALCSLGLSFLICPGLWVDQDGLKALPALPGLGAEPQFL